MIWSPRPLLSSVVSDGVCSSHRQLRRLHRGASILQQPGGGGEHGHALPHERLPLQEGHGDLQLQLLPQHPGRAPQQTGRRWSNLLLVNKKSVY